MYLKYLHGCQYELIKTTLLTYTFSIKETTKPQARRYIRFELFHGLKKSVESKAGVCQIVDNFCIPIESSWDIACYLQIKKLSLEHTARLGAIAARWLKALHNSLI